MDGGVRDKRTSTVNAINYVTVKIVVDTPGVIDTKDIDRESQFSPNAPAFDAPITHQI